MVLLGVEKWRRSVVVNNGRGGKSGIDEGNGFGVRSRRVEFWWGEEISVFEWQDGVR